MTLDELRKAVADGHGRHGAPRDRRHAGPAAGKRLHRVALPRRGARARRRGLQLPARGRHGDGARRGLRDVVVGRGYGDFVMSPTSRRCGRCRGCEGTALVHVRRRGGTTAPRRRVAAPDPARASSTARPSRATRRRRLRARVHRVQGHLRRGLGARATATSTPANLYNLDYSLLGTARVEPSRRHPQRDARRRACRSSTRRASATSASTRSTSATPTRSSTADHHAIYKNGAKEIAAQEGMAITFMAKFNEHEGNSCHIHCSLADADGENAVRRRRPTRSSSTSSPASSRRMRELALLFAPNVNSYKRYAAGLVRPDRGRLGPRQPHLLAPRRRPRAVAAGREPAPRRRRQPVPRAPRRCSPAGLARHRARARARARAQGQRVAEAEPRACPRRCARRATSSLAASSPAKAFGERSSTTTSTTADASRRVRRGGHRLGAPAHVRARL